MMFPFVERPLFKRISSYNLSAMATSGSGTGVPLPLAG